MKIGVIGAFGFDKMDTGGQAVKTRALYDGLKEYFDEGNVMYLDTAEWIKNPVRLVFQLFKIVQECEYLIMLPAQNGVNVFSYVLLYAQNRGKKIYYDVIGGWLPELIENKKKLCKCLRQFDGIWVETEQMKRDLETLHFKNISVIPNFKEITPLDINELLIKDKYPLPICTFSRVIKEKGISDAIEAVNKINTKYKNALLTLDIYGEIGEEYKDEFWELLRNVPSYIRYKGVVFPQESVNVIKNYYLLLFPTHFFTEGIPGTLIDAYCAGVPVISALWKNYIGVFDDGIVGYGYELGNIYAFQECLENAALHINDTNEMKNKCLNKAKYFSKDAVMEQIVNIINDSAN